MTTLNPSHLLISRNPPRSPAHPQLAPALTSRHPPAPPLGPPQARSNAWHGHDYRHRRPVGEGGNSQEGFELFVDGEGDEDGDDDVNSPVEGEEGEEKVDVHPTFSGDGVLPGRIKVVVGSYEFWCHKEVLYFASPFFQGLLQGSWAETNHGLGHEHGHDSQSRSPSRSVLTSRSITPSPSTNEAIMDDDCLPVTTDTDLPTTLPLLVVSGEGNSTAGRLGTTTWADGETEWEDEDEDENGDSRKASVYLDAIEDGPVIFSVMQELRELPDNTPVVPDISHLIISPPEPGATRNTSPSLLPTSLLPLPCPNLLDLSRTTKVGGRSSPKKHRPFTRGSRRRFSCSSTHSVIREIILRRRGAGGGDTHPTGPAQLRTRTRAEAVVELKEEKAGAFQDFLFWAYPHLDCKVTWTNVEDLLNLSSKLLVPPLKRLCETFLMTHAPGRPIMTLHLAETHGNAELFKEASRFVLDIAQWDKKEMGVLSERTQLKLSMRRTWFLERLLKLASVDVRKDYSCRHDCPDPARCQILLDEKWRQAYTAVTRLSPPQPSVAFRWLRQLEVSPTNPNLAMPHPFCQNTAKSWIINMFDRMFDRMTQKTSVSSAPGTEKYWLWIAMHD